MSARSRTPGFVRCLLLIACMDVLPRLVGFRRALAVVRRLGRARSGPGAPRQLVAATARRVSLAAAFYPRRALCLEQSFALFVLLRRRGAAAELRLGVQPRPFYAHAWVEVDGMALDERMEVRQQMGIFHGLRI